MTANNETGSITTIVGEREFVVERIFNAPKELVYKEFTQPEHLALWWAPRPYTIPVCKIDLRPNGVWHYCMRSPEGHEHWVKSVYQEVVEAERIVYTVVFADKDENPTGEAPEQLGTLTFTELNGKTKLSMRVQFGSDADLKTTLKMGMVEGLTMAFNNLDPLLTEI